MEHGSLEDSKASTFSIMDEDHTLANSVRFVSTKRDPAKDVLKDSLQNLMLMCQHVRGTFDTAVADFRSNNPAEAMDIDLTKK